ncbi:S-layer homology domain-containing protein [Thermacetogenium phaeum]|nr:S-layer homology domain-containing protein [Thermacetogenium phaeum]
MSKLYTNRPLLGNIGLVVFLAFLVTLTFGTVPQAQAADQTTDGKTVHVDKSSTSSDGTVEFTITITSPTDFDDSLLELFLRKSDGTEITSTSVYVYESAYEVSKQVYQFVYDWVYKFNTADLPMNVTFVVYLNEVELPSITLTVEPPPPESVGGGGPAVPPTTTVSTGTVAVEDGVGTLTVDASKVARLLDDPQLKEIEFAIPADLAVVGDVVMPAAVLADVFEAGKAAVFEVGGVRLVIEPGDLDVKDVQLLAEEGATVAVSVVKATAPVQYGLKVASDVYEIKMEVTGADGLKKGEIASFSKPITLTLPYSTDRLQGMSEDLLSIFRYGEKTGKWDLVPGSRVDKVNKTVSVGSYSLSKYAVMAYEAAFTDVAGHWAEETIKLMAAKGIIKGMTATTFAPEAEVTRAQFATMLVNALNIRQQAATGTRFSDVPATAWFANTVETAAANGLLNGYPDGSFKPNAKITRQELAVMVANALKFRGRDAAELTAEEVNAILSGYSDRGQIGSWAKRAAAVVVKSGIVKGRAVDQFAPLATAKRCEAVVMIKQMLSFLGEL